MSGDVTVGVIANPASGRDIRRLVAGASVVGNADKAAMVFRLLAGLRATGVTRVLMMPATDGLSTTLRRLIRSAGDLPQLEELDMPLDGSARDSIAAAERMRDLGVRAIVVLGGDGTHRVVATVCGETPLCALSTGTNNVFPQMRETTVAGMAVGLVATGRSTAVRRENALEVVVDGVRHLALVDVAVSDEPFAGAGALHRVDRIREVVVSFADPGAVGLSAIAGAVHPLARAGGRGLHVRLGNEGRLVRVPIAPGLVVPVAVAEHRVIGTGEAVDLAPGTIALDGERELERHEQPATVRLVPGPLTIDIDAALRTRSRPAAGCSV